MVDLDHALQAAEDPHAPYTFPKGTNRSVGNAMTTTDHAPTSTSSPTIGALVFSPDDMRRIQNELQRFLTEYDFGLREVETKLGILRDEFRHMHDYNPIEHLSSRGEVCGQHLCQGTAKRTSRWTRSRPRTHHRHRRRPRDLQLCPGRPPALRPPHPAGRHHDPSSQGLHRRAQSPSPNGCKSLHAVVDVPVSLSMERIHVPVEIQFRTMAMDIWASLEHKIYYKYDRNVRAELLGDLTDAADTAAALDAFAWSGYTASYTAPSPRPASATYRDARPARRTTSRTSPGPRHRQA